jgi:hypothetical protein
MTGFEMMPRSLTSGAGSRAWRWSPPFARRTGNSELVREILEAALAQRSFAERVDHLRGRLQLRHNGLSGWPRQVRERNWRP